MASTPRLTPASPPSSGPVRFVGTLPPGAYMRPIAELHTMNPVDRLEAHAGDEGFGIEKLVERILRDGYDLSLPALVGSHGHDEDEIWDGQHRFRALERLGSDVAPVMPASAEYHWPELEGLR